MDQHNIAYKSIIQHKLSGETMTQFLNRIKNQNNIPNIKMCYSGRLDPMARGKVFILFNEECKTVDFYNKKSKTYQFEVIVGLQTKSDDPLGVLENIDLNITQEKVNYIKEFIEKHLIKLFNIDSFYQKFHIYSSKKVGGEPLWLHTQNNHNLENPTPSHFVSVYDYELKDSKIYNYHSWKDEIINLINNIDKKCNFNQENIIKQWQNLEKELELELELDINHKIQNIYSIPIALTVSSGFYVRQFVRDLSDMLKIPLMVYDINRTEIYI